MSDHGVETRQFGHRARLALPLAVALKADGQAHAARTMWNCLHAWWQMMPKEKRTLANADAAIRQARQEINFLAVLPAQAAQAVLKTYFQAWKNCWDGRANAPNFKARFRTALTVDVPQGRDLVSGRHRYCVSPLGRARPAPENLRSDRTGRGPAVAKAVGLCTRGARARYQ